LETAAGRIVCDPWFTPAYFSPWLPFPDNSGIDPALLADAEYLYVSHLHRYHFGPAWLRQHMSKDTTVLPRAVGQTVPPGRDRGERRGRRAP
jgi:UDP-MurNAc hydroxylase